LTATVLCLAVSGLLASTDNMDSIMNSYCGSLQPRQPGPLAG
jgi:hypothetical protein